MKRGWPLVKLVVIAVVIWLVVTWGARANPKLPPEPPLATGPIPDFTIVDPEYKGRTAHQWYRAYQHEHHRLVYTVRHHPTVSEALNLACTVYGSCATLWRRARCESHLWPYAHNRSGASGLLQFMPSTWSSTPYRGFSIWSPYANALAAGWMIRAGRGGEWACR